MLFCSYKYENNPIKNSRASFASLEPCATKCCSINKFKVLILDESLLPTCLIYNSNRRNPLHLLQSSSGHPSSSLVYFPPFLISHQWPMPAVVLEVVNRGSVGQAPDRTWEIFSLDKRRHCEGDHLLLLLACKCFSLWSSYYKLLLCVVDGHYHPSSTLSNDSWMNERMNE